MRAFATGLLSAALLVSGQTVVLADCECRANGRLYQHGELACLRLPTGDQLALCDKVLNNSSWKKLRDGCPEAAGGGIGLRNGGALPGSQPNVDSHTNSPAANSG